VVRLPAPSTVGRLLALAACLSLLPASAQLALDAPSPGWVQTFGSAPFSGNVRALAVGADPGGDGPALFVGSALVRKWDGEAWSQLGSSFVQPVNAVTVFDDGRGGGPKLYAGGEFAVTDPAPGNHIAQWDGTAWSPLGSGMDDDVNALVGFDDGSGPALYAGGAFDVAGGQPIRGFARWDGAGWSAVGTGAFTGEINGLAVFDDGNGPALYVAGGFSSVGGVAAKNIARWDGTGWSELGAGTLGTVSALTVFDDGGGPALVAGGYFVKAGTVQTKGGVAKWDGSTWSAFGTNLSNIALALAVHDDGSAGRPSTPPRRARAGADRAHPRAADGRRWRPHAELGRGPAGVPSGTSLYFQYAIQDAAAVQGVALSNALQATTP
jgi:trimeric autotransporter adhesin